MFSGMISAIGTITGRVSSGSGVRLGVAFPGTGEALIEGESVAVDGACLTVTSPAGQAFSADVSAETVFRTTLSGIRVGSRVNLERALRVSDRLGGHLVLGHVDATVRVQSVRRESGFARMRLSLPDDLAPEVAEKGSVAIDGVSLTVALLGRGYFEVALVPSTLGSTTLSDRRTGDSVNLETDVLAKYVRRLLGREDTDRDGHLRDLLGAQG